MAGQGTPRFDMPGKMEGLLAMLAKYYERNGQQIHRRIIVNAKYHIHEGWTSDNWNGGTYGHALFLQIPSDLYLEVVNDQDQYRGAICEQLNKIGNAPNEHIAEVFFELPNEEVSSDWRESSGLLLASTTARVTAQNDRISKIWTPGHLRLFLSHKSEYRVETAALKEGLKPYGVSCFVAHDDIEPTKEWQGEIELALLSMDALAALMTEEFHQSSWTDQEVGAAVGRRVPIIPIKLGKDPYGFIGKYQAVRGAGLSSVDLAKKVNDLLGLFPSLQSKLEECLVFRFENAVNFKDANELMGRLEALERLPPQLIDRIESAPEGNSQLKGAFAVKNSLAGVVRRLRGAWQLPE